MKLALLIGLSAAPAVMGCDVDAATACASSYVTDLMGALLDDEKTCTVIAANAKCNLGAGCWTGDVSGDVLKSACTSSATSYSCDATVCDSGTALAPSALLLAAITATVYKIC